MSSLRHWPVVPWLSVRPPNLCGLLDDNEQYPADDFAPYLTIFLVAHAMIPILFVVDRAWQLSMTIELIVALPVFAAVTLGLLPYAKGSVIGIAWAFAVIQELPPGSGERAR